MLLTSGSGRPQLEVMASDPLSTTRPEKVVVTVRIRPAHSNEQIAWNTDSRVLSYSGGPNSDASGPGVSERHGPNSWAYDRVFSDKCTEEEVFMHSGALSCVQGATCGLNSIVFAYGQTGAGKTHTMAAVMRMAASHIFNHKKATPSRDFLIRMSAMEIYNEVVRDMLEPGRDSTGSQGGAVVASPMSTSTGGAAGVLPPASAAQGSIMSGPGLKVLEDPEQGGTWVEGLREEAVLSEEQVIHMLTELEGRRQIRDTRMNQTSSRSHQIVRLTIESRPAVLNASQTTDTGAASGASAGQDALSESVMVSTLSFVDLAGSERLSQATITGDVMYGMGNEALELQKERMRQKEASSINRSLLTLGTVIRALGADPGARKHIPYRDSKLTRILQPALAGNARMAIIVAISPAAASVENTRAALHFANAAKRVVMTPQVNEILCPEAVIRRMQAEINHLKGQLHGTQWQELLQAKEAEVRRAGEQAQVLQRRVQNLERLILHDPVSKDQECLKVRHSYDDVERSSLSGWWQQPPLQSVVGGSDSHSTVAQYRQHSVPPGGARASWSAGAGASWESGMRVSQPQEPAHGAEACGGACHEQSQPQTDVAQARAMTAADTLDNGGCTRALGATAQASVTAAGGAPTASDASRILQHGSSANTRAPAQYLGGRAVGATPLLLDCLLAPVVRQAVSQGGSASSAKVGSEPGTQPQRPSAAPRSASMAHAPRRGTGTGVPPTVPKLNLTKVALQNYEAPHSSDVDAALAGLQAEVHCIRSTAAVSGMLPAALAPASVPVNTPQSASQAQDDPGAVTAREQSLPDLGRDAAGSHMGSSQGVLDAKVQHLQQGLAMLEAAELSDKAEAGPQSEVSTVGPAHSATSSLAGSNTDPAAQRQALIGAIKSEMSRVRALTDAEARAGAALSNLHSRMAGSVQPSAERDLEDDPDADPSFNALPGWMVQVFLATKQEEHETASCDTGMRASALSRPHSPAHTVRTQPPDTPPTPLADTPGSVDLNPDYPGISWHARTPALTGAAARPRYTTPPHSGERAKAASVATEESGGQGSHMYSGESGGGREEEEEEEEVQSNCASSCVVVRAAGEVEPRPGPDKRSQELSTGSPGPPSGTTAQVDDLQAVSVTPCSKGLGKHLTGSTGLLHSSGKPMVMSLERASGTTGTLGLGAASGGGATPSVASDVRWDSHRVRQVLQDQKSEITHWYKSELRRLRAEVVGASAADVAALKDAIEQFRETVERLEVQKKLLLVQVLRLETALEESQASLQSVITERDVARSEAEQARAAAKAAAAIAHRVQAQAEAQQQYEDGGMSESGNVVHMQHALSMFDQEDSGWAAQDTPETLMPRIIDMWHELHVPLAFRSQFYLTCYAGNREVFFFETVYRQLEFKRARLAESGPVGVVAQRHRREAGRNLDVERKHLASAIKHQLSDPEREALYASWGVDSLSKERKLQLVNKVWHPDTLKQPDGALRSAQLVVMLLGTDAVEHALELVFGMQAAAPRAPAKSGLGGMVSNLVQRLATPRGRRPSPLGTNATCSPSHGSAGATHHPFQPSQSQQGLGTAPNSARSAGSTTTTTAPVAAKPVAPTPRRGSFGSLLSSRLSFMRGGTHTAAPSEHVSDSILSTAHVNTRVSAQGRPT